MMITSTIAIDVGAHRWRRTYDPGTLDRHAAEALRNADVGDAVRLIVRELCPAQVPESLSWARPDLLYTIEADNPAVCREWERALHEAAVINHGAH